MFCMLLTTEDHLFPVPIYLIGIITETVCVFTVRYETKLYLVFVLIFISNGFISCVYVKTLRVSIGHIILSSYHQQRHLFITDMKC